MPSVSERFRVAPGSRAGVGEVDPRSSEGAPGDKAATVAVSAVLQARFGALQGRLWAEDRRSLLIVLQGIDTSGKDGVIRHVFNAVNPQASEVTAFKVPTEEELAHDFLWRAHRNTPRTGEIGVFNRSYYEDVLVVRVHGLVPEATWRERFRLINQFEELLAHGGTTAVKLLLHISKDEQARRLRERIERPDKRWKFRPADLAERRHWDAYQEAFEDALSRTSTEVAPWYIVPADRKWYRNWLVSTILVETLERLDPQYPAGADLSGVVVE